MAFVTSVKVDDVRAREGEKAVGGMKVGQSERAVVLLTDASMDTTSSLSRTTAESLIIAALESIYRGLDW